MAYPDLPNNRLIVNNIDLTERFKMVLVDGYSLEPPSPKIYTVDIPGGNGVIDLTEAFMGDTVYENRKQTFTFYIIDIQDFEQFKTEVSDLLHGKSFDYTMTMDPGYTYHGRFSISSYEHGSYPVGIVGVIEIEIDAEPYKYKKQQVYKVDAIGGKLFSCSSGRKRVCPTIESNTAFTVIFDNKEYTLPIGTWKVNDILLTHGANEMYFNSFEIFSFTWGDFGIPAFEATKTYAVGDYVTYSSNAYKCTTAITTPAAWDASKWSDITFNSASTYSIGDYVRYTPSGSTAKTYKCTTAITTAGAWDASKWIEINTVNWGDFGTKKLFEWYKTKSNGSYVIQRWSDLASTTWTSLANQTWGSLTYRATDTELVDPIYMAYDWGDL